MILVTGTKRSGTSLWMQILRAAGFPSIGERYLGNWESSISEANPRGFWESPLRRGVFYATNPHPRTGDFIAPSASRRHALKVFIPGLIRTDYAYIDRVVATLRPWQEYCASLRRLYALEDRFLADLPPEEGPDGELVQPLERARRGRVPLHPALEWWFENYDFIRDVATRRYAVNLVSYHRLLEDPEPVLARVFEWLGGGDPEPAVAAVDPALRTQRDPTIDDAPVDDEAIAVFDALHDSIYRTQSLSKGLIERMNALNSRLEEEHLKPKTREKGL